MHYSWDSQSVDLHSVLACLCIYTLQYLLSIVLEHVGDHRLEDPLVLYLNEMMVHNHYLTITSNLNLPIIDMSVLYHIYTCTCVLCCFALFVCLTLLACFFLPSHLSFKNMYTGTCNAGTFLLLGALESCEVCLNEELDSTALGERGGGKRGRGTGGRGGEGYGGKEWSEGLVHM